MPQLEQTTGRRETFARWTFVLVSAALLAIMVAASFDFGVTWDEKGRHGYGQAVWDYLRGVRGSADFGGDDDGNFYGGLFDVICVAVERWVPIDRFVLRHIINALFGWVGVVFAGGLASRLFGTWSGVLAMILLAVSPRYFADSMNNPKDLPFAAMSIAALYYFSTISPRWPYLSRTTALKIMITLALALNIRAGALLYVGYFGLLVGGYVIAERNRDWRRLADTAARVAVVVLGVMLLGTVFWPWAQRAPFTRPFQALFGFANFPYVANLMFDGRVEVSNSLPWYYASWWLLITTPPVVLAGALLSCVSFRRPSADAVRTAALWSVVLLPLALVIAEHATLYNGIRHLLFIYPVLAVLAAAGWSRWLSASGRPWLRTVSATLLGIGLINVVGFDLRSHPNETVYFNELVGGPRGAFAKYEMDYWGNCMMEAVAWSARTASSAGVRIVISGDPLHLIQLDAERFPQLDAVPPTRNQHALTLLLGHGSGQAMTGLATRDDALYRVHTADDAVLCVVVPGPTFDELRPHLSELPPGFSYRPVSR